MRFITAFALLSATAMATNHGNGYGHEQQKGYESGWGAGSGWGDAAKPTPHPVEQAPPPPYHEAPPPAHYPAPPAHEAPPPVHEVPPVHEPPAPVQEPPAHEAPPPAHEAPPHVTPAPDGYELDVQPPPEGKKVHTVTVGGDAGLVYTPPFVHAEVGDIVHFIFHKQNHSVTQSTFAKPCNRLETGEDSGLLPNPNNTVVPAPVWEYTVKEKEPTWWYCKQRTGTHCGKGMVFAINPTEEKTFDKFREVAIQINGTAAVTTTSVPEATPPPAPVDSTVTLIGEPTGAPEPPAAPPSQPPPEGVDAPYMTPGWNEKGDPSACNCACFCGVGSFPQGDGWGSYGGVGGALKTPW